MTDKEQVIIDGVDVSKCNFAILPKDSCPAKSRPYAREISCIACKEHNTILNYCKNNPNCYFKQLAHKTRECEKYEKRAVCFKDVNKQLGYKYLTIKQECESLKKDYAELEQECERLKSYGATLLADKNAMEIGRDDYMQRCKQLEQECEELKEKNKVLQKLVSELEYNTQTGIELNDRYCNALEEIEKIVNEPCVADAQEDCKHCDNWCEHKDILDIINKVKGERDE